MSDSKQATLEEMRAEVVAKAHGVCLELMDAAFAKAKDGDADAALTFMRAAVVASEIEF